MAEVILQYVQQLRLVKVTRQPLGKMLPHSRHEGLRNIGKGVVYAEVETEGQV